MIYGKSRINVNPLTSISLMPAVKKFTLLLIDTKPRSAGGKLKGLNHQVYRRNNLTTTKNHIISKNKASVLDSSTSSMILKTRILTRFLQNYGHVLHTKYKQERGDWISLSQTSFRIKKDMKIVVYH